MMVAALPDTKSGMRRRPHAGLRFRENAAGAVNDLASIWENDAAIRANAVISLGTRPVAKKLTRSMHPAMQRNYRSRRVEHRD